MIKYPKDQTERTLNELFLAFEDLPVLARLEYASNLVCNRAGDPEDEKFDPTLSLAGQVIDDVIKVLRSRIPRAVRARTHEAEVVSRVESLKAVSGKFEIVGIPILGRESQISPAPQSRFQPHREGLRKAKGAFAQGRNANGRGARTCDRQPRSSLPANRVRELLRRMRL